MKNVDVFWSFRSPYSYLATPQMLELKRRYHVKVNLRVVLPLAMRAPEKLFTPENVIRSRYILMDWARRADFLGMDHAWPSPDPIVQDLQTMKISEHQPYIYRLSHLGVEAQRLGKGIEFACAVARLLWGGTKDWDHGEHLANAADSVGLNLIDMEGAIAEGEHANEIEENHRQLELVGHWGVPTFVVDNEVFFGQDRIDTLCWRLNQLDLLK